MISVRSRRQPDVTCSLLRCCAFVNRSDYVQLKHDGLAVVDSNIGPSVEFQERAMHKRLISGVAAAVVAVSTVVGAQNGTPINPNSKNTLTVAVYGDSPYGTIPTDTTQTDKTLAFIDSINQDPKVDLVLHVGDIHSGSQFCTEAYDRQIYDLWTTFKNPLIYTPGDNEWADCHKAKKGGGLPATRLAAERSAC